MQSTRTTEHLLRAATATLLLFASMPAWGDFAPEEWRGRKAYIAGTIRDVSGLPLTHAKVAGSGTEWSPDGMDGLQKTFEAYTDSLGRYRLELPAGADDAWVEHPDRGSFPGIGLLMRAPIPPGEHHADFQFQLFHVRGILLGPDSLPASKGTVVYYDTPPKGSGMCGTGLPQASVTKGLFEVTVQHAARISFSAGLSDHPFGLPSTYKEIQINGDTLITLQVGGIPVEGTIRGYGGRALGGAVVTVMGDNFSDEVHADAFGRFRVSVTKGTYRWRVDPGINGFQRWETAEPPEITGPSKVDLALASVRWTGRVRDRQTGAYLDSIHVRAAQQGVDWWHAGADCLTGPRGEFSLYLRRGAVFDLSLSDENYPRVAVPVSVTSADLERMYARVRRRTVTGVSATSDSTFDIDMEPVRR